MASTRIPPIQLLPAFEAAARLLSFSKAAEELHVTTAAISQQIKQLESHLGFPLFHRYTRRIELTEVGQQFASVASQTLSVYRLGHAELIHHYNKPSLKLNTTPLIAHEILFPKLSDFQNRHSNVSISIDASMEFTDFDKQLIDAAIRVGYGQWPGLESWKICRCEAVVLASPELLAKQPIQQISDLQSHTLIHRRQPLFGWDFFAKHNDLFYIRGKSDLVLDTDLAAIRAAEQGLGVALSILPIASKKPAFLESKRLVQVFPSIKLPIHAYFVFSPNNEKKQLLKETFNWIQSCITQTTNYD